MSLQNVIFNYHKETQNTKWYIIIEGCFSKVIGCKRDWSNPVVPTVASTEVPKVGSLNFKRPFARGTVVICL
jgi:hypothetical protein